MLFMKKFHIDKKRLSTSASIWKKKPSSHLWNHWWAHSPGFVNCCLNAAFDSLSVHIGFCCPSRLFSIYGGNGRLLFSWRIALLRDPALLLRRAPRPDLLVVFQCFWFDRSKYFVGSFFLSVCRAVLLRYTSAGSFFFIQSFPTPTAALTCILTLENRTYNRRLRAGRPAKRPSRFCKHWVPLKLFAKRNTDPRSMENRLFENFFKSTNTQGYIRTECFWPVNHHVLFF